LSVEKIIQSWQKGSFKPIYWFEGEEDFYIDQLMEYAEKNLVPESEAAFNLTIFYGKDADWAALTNTCRRYPMFADRQVVLLKEAQHMKDIDKLEPYIENPLPTTVLVVSYKGKKYDRRTKFFKHLQSRAELFESPKIYDDRLGGWIKNYVQSQGLSISEKSVSLLEEHIGNNLSRIANEVEKLTINMGGRKQITEEDIERYIGISKEYNAFELSGAIARKDLSKALRIVQYFEHNPKAGPLQAVLPAIYSQLSRVYTAFEVSANTPMKLRAHFSNNPSAIETGSYYMKNYGPEGVNKCLLLLHEYNLKSIGINSYGTEGSSLMKELMVKMVLG